MSDDRERDDRSLNASAPPTFETFGEERRYRLERLAGVCRVFGRLGYSEGLLGHVTVRDPEHPDRFWMNPVGVAFRQMAVSHLVQVAHDGSVLNGERAVNLVGFRLHSALHEARPEVNAVCHAHSLYGKAWSSLGRCLDPITQDSAVLFEQQALIPPPRVELTMEDAKEFARQFGDKRVGIQVGHGVFSTGKTVEEAAWWFITMETSCHAQLLAEAAGTPLLWDPDEARMAVAALGTPDYGWESFQPFWDEIIESDPELLT
jgi:ribulose-5-phosphate 4-epimerase/fuculose-1-phosphate aldolase